MAFARRRGENGVAGCWLATARSHQGVAKSINDRNQKRVPWRAYKAWPVANTRGGGRARKNNWRDRLKLVRYGTVVVIFSRRRIYLVLAALGGIISKAACNESNGESSADRPTLLAFSRKMKVSQIGGEKSFLVHWLFRRRQNINNHRDIGVVLMMRRRARKGCWQLVSPEAEA